MSSSPLWLYWALLVASVEEAVVAPDGEVDGVTAAGSMMMVRVDVEVMPARCSGPPMAAKYRKERQGSSK